MIQDIYPHQFNNAYNCVSEVEANDYIFHFKGSSILLKQDGDGIALPQNKDVVYVNQKAVFLFTIDGVNCFLIWELSEALSSLLVYHEIGFSGTIYPKVVDWCGSVALQLKNWYLQNKFCGSCGSFTTHKKDERALVCSSCQSVIFPRISPAIIVAIVYKDEILLARGANFKEGFFSLVAGYVDVGESIEDAVIREVKEEVGLDIQKISYYKSQPWPFSGSLMMGFVARVDSLQAIKIDGVEIIEAGWFTRGNLPEYPRKRSVAGEIIEKFRVGELIVD